MAEGGFKRILVAVDGSEHGNHAAWVGGELARALGARLTLLAVYTAPSSALGEPNYSAALNQALAEARDAIGAARQVVTRAGGAEPETESLAGAPAETIVRLARERGYDLVVVGTRGRGRVRAALLGSVSTAVAAGAGRPVLVVGAPA